MNAKLQLPDTYIDATEAGAELRANCLASKLHLKWLGVTRSLSAEQMASLVDGSEVDSKMIRGSKRLLENGHPTMKLLGNIRNRIISNWRALTLPFVEAGTRLIPRQLVSEFESRMTFLKNELASAVDELQQEWPKLKEAAAARLGTLYNPDDYPADNLEELFSVSWSYPETSVPSYLMAIDAGVYRREAARVAEKFEQAVELAEQGFVEEFNKLVSHLTERLTDSDGERKIFRDSSLESLREFFQRFRQMRLGGRAGEQLEELIAEAQGIVAGIIPQDLRDSSSLRQNVAQDLARVGRDLEGLMVTRPRRKIIRMGGGE